MICEVAYPYQSTSDTKIGFCPAGNKSRFARFYLFGNYRPDRKNAAAPTRKNPNAYDKLTDCY